MNFVERKFELRAWNDGWNEMVYSQIWDESCFQKREFYPFCFQVGFSHYPESKWILMQAIGITDAIGGKIYEGDILISYGKCFVVKYFPEYCAYGAQCIQDREHLLWASVIKSLAIAGNVFENSQLLTI